MDNRNGDRHGAKWHTQVRNIPTDVWQRVRSAATARDITIGEYLTRCILVAEAARELRDEPVGYEDFYEGMGKMLSELNMDVVRA